MDNKKEKNFFNKVRDMFGNWYKRYTIHKSERDSNLEAEHGRFNIRRSIEQFTKQLWDEASIERRMEQILRKRSREGKVEKLQKGEKTVHQRNIRLSRFSGTQTYRDLVKAWQQWERIAYYSLRFPEQRKEGVSLDYYIGFQNGLLADIEANRKLFTDAQIKIFKADQEKIENDKTK